MKEFNSKTLDELRKDLNAVLEVVEELHGIKLDIGSIKYGAESCRMTLTATCATDESGNSLNKNELEYNKMLDSNKMFSPDKKFLALGESFISNGNQFVICGWKPRSRKYPLLGKNKAGKIYKFPGFRAEKK